MHWRLKDWSNSPPISHLNCIFHTNKSSAQKLSKFLYFHVTLIIFFTSVRLSSKTNISKEPYWLPKYMRLHTKFNFGIWRFIVNHILMNWMYCSLPKIMMTSSNANIFCITGPLCGEFTSPGEFTAQRPVTWSFNVFFDPCPNKRLSKQPRGWWFETPSWSLWRQCNDISSV